MNKVSPLVIQETFIAFLAMCVTLRTNADFFTMRSSAESSDQSAQNALDLLLNMSNARELVGNALQVGAMAHQKTSLYISGRYVECLHFENSIKMD